MKESHVNSVGEQTNLTYCPPCGPGSDLSYGGVFQRIFPWLIALCQPVLRQFGRKSVKVSATFVTHVKGALQTILVYFSSGTRSKRVEFRVRTNID